MKTLSERFAELVSGCFTAIWIQSREPQEAIAELTVTCRDRDRDWQLATWNIDRGLGCGSNTDGESPIAADPLSAIRAANALTDSKTSILVLENFHRFISSVEIVQTLVNQIHAGKQTRTILVVLSPVIDLPPELEKLFVVLEHELPDQTQLRQIAEAIGTEDGELPEGEELQRVLDSASGLTRGEAESAYSLSLVRHGRIQPETVWEIKSQMLKKSGLLEMYRGDADFQSLGGMNGLKTFCQQALASTSDKARPRGVMLLSPPGCGKSQICKALGKETGRPVIMLDTGSLMGSLVGQTEQRTREAIRVIEAMGKTVVLIDEVEKALSGATGSGQGDSGVSSRMFGSLLTWLNDRQSDTFVVCTANDVSRLPPEFARAERFDGVFFLDLPTREEKDAIWDIYYGHYEIDPSLRRPDDADWTGAEIKACCRLSVLLNLKPIAASKYIVPVAVTAAESIEKLRTWASGRCLDATRGGIYVRPQRKSKTRQVEKGVGPPPSLN